jgi:hypothetical protein
VLRAAGLDALLASEVGQSDASDGQRNAQLDDR